MLIPEVITAPLLAKVFGVVSALFIGLWAKVKADFAKVKAEVVKIEGEAVAEEKAVVAKIKALF